MTTSKVVRDANVLDNYRLKSTAGVGAQGDRCLATRPPRLSQALGENKAVMAIIKGKPDGGSGGKRGHSNMDHWMHTDEIKSAAKKARRLAAKAAIAAEFVDCIKSSKEFHCAKCGAAWRMPSTVSLSARQAVVTLVRSNSMIAELQRLRAEGFDLATSKAAISHIPRTAGKCHTCSAALTEDWEAGDCRKCGAFNLDW